MSNGPTAAPSGRRGRSAAALRAAAAVLALVIVGTGCSRVTAAPPDAGTGGTGANAASGNTVADGGTDSAVTVWGQPAPAGTGALEAVSCGSAQDCWAAGQTVSNVLTDPVTKAPTPSTVVIDATVDSGVTWTAEKATVTNPTDLADIDCPDRLHCMAVGTANDNGPLLGAVLVTSDGGRSWKPMDAPAGSVDLSAVRCTNASDCLVLATDGSTYWSASTSDGGQVWQRGGSLPAGFAGISNVACVNATTCVTTGYVSTAPGKGIGAIAVTDDDGATWAAATVPQGTGLLHGVSCATPLTCIAVGTKSTTITDVAQSQGEILASTDGGHTWTAITAPPGIDDAFAVSCPTASTCASVGTVWTRPTASTPTTPQTPTGSVVTTTDGGVTWHPPETRYIPVGLTDVDCPISTSCVAAGGNTLARLVLPLPKPTSHTKS
jgi:photosystem II stability/assembly factor-like uncharacterized protein